MTFTFDELKLARERGYSDDEIWNTLASEDKEIGLAKQRGYSLEEVASITSGQPIPEPKPSGTSFGEEVSQLGSAFVESIGRPLENMGESFESFGFTGVADALKGAITEPENYVSAGQRFMEPAPDEAQFMGFAWQYAPRAAVEQVGQAIGAIGTRAVGAAAGGAVAGPPGAIAGGFLGPAVFGAAQVIGPVAKERAMNNGREVPNNSDLIAATLTAIGSGSLDAIGAKYLPGGEKATGKFFKRVASSFLGEGLLTEAPQSVIEQIGATAGTEKGLNINVKQAVGEGLIGGTSAAGLTAIVSPFSKPAENQVIRTPEQAEELDIDSKANQEAVLLMGDPADQTQNERVTKLKEIESVIANNETLMTGLEPNAPERSKLDLENRVAKKEAEKLKAEITQGAGLSETITEVEKQQIELAKAITEPAPEVVAPAPEVALEAPAPVTEAITPPTEVAPAAEIKNEDKLISENQLVGTSPDFMIVRDLYQRPDGSRYSIPKSSSIPLTGNTALIKLNRELTAEQLIEKYPVEQIKPTTPPITPAPVAETPAVAPAPEVAPKLERTSAGKEIIKQAKEGGVNLAELDLIESAIQQIDNPESFVIPESTTAEAVQYLQYTPEGTSVVSHLQKLSKSTDKRDAGIKRRTTAILEKITPAPAVSEPPTPEPTAEVAPAPIVKQSKKRKGILGEQYINKDWTSLTKDELPQLNRELYNYYDWAKTVVDKLIPNANDFEKKALIMELRNEITEETAKPEFKDREQYILAQKVAGELITGKRRKILQRAKERAMGDEYAAWEMGGRFEESPISVEAFDSNAKGRPLPEGYTKQGDVYVYQAPAVSETITPAEPEGKAEAIKFADEALRERDKEVGRYKKKADVERKAGREEMAQRYEGIIDDLMSVPANEFKQDVIENPAYYIESNVDPFLRFKNKEVNRAAPLTPSKRKREAGGVLIPSREDLIQAGQNIYEAGMEFGAWAKQMIQRFGDAVRQFLADVWEAVSGFPAKLEEMAGYLPGKGERGAVTFGRGEEPPKKPAEPAPVTPAEPAPEKPAEEKPTKRAEPKRREKIMGVEAGPLIETQDGIIAKTKDKLKTLFDPEVVNEANTSTAYRAIGILSGTNRDAARQYAESINALTAEGLGEDADTANEISMGAALFVNNLFEYAVKLAAKGDRKMLGLMVSNINKLPTGQMGASDAGRTLRARVELKARFLMMAQAEQDAFTNYVAEFIYGPNPTEAQIKSIKDAYSATQKVAKPTEEELTDEIAKVGEKTYTDLVSKINDDFTKAAEKDKDARDAELKELSDEYNKIQDKAETEIEKLAEIQSDTPSFARKKVNEIRAIVSADLKQRPDLGRKAPWKSMLIAKLQNAGVSPANAETLADLVWRQHEINATSRELESINKAIEKGPISEIIKQIKDTPIEQQQAPDWRYKVMRDYLRKAGLSMAQAERIAKLMDISLQKRFTEAKEKAFTESIEKSAPWKSGDARSKRAFQQVIKALRAGALDPSRNFLNDVAAANGWTGFTDSQYGKLIKLDSILSNPKSSDADKAEAHKAIQNIISNSKLPIRARDVIGQFYDAQALSGIPTITVNMVSPIGMAAKNALVQAASGVATFRPDQIDAAFRTLMDSIKSWANTVAYSFKNNVTVYSNVEYLVNDEGLLKLYNRGKEQFKKGKTPKDRADGVKNMMVGMWDYVRRILNALDYGAIASLQNQTVPKYALAAMQAKGMSSKDGTKMLNAMFEAKRNFYEQQIAAGVDKNKASVLADEFFVSSWRQALTDAKLPAQQVIDSAINDAMSAVGRTRASLDNFRDENTNLQDAGVTSLPALWLLQSMANAANKSDSQLIKIFARIIYGFAVVPARVFRETAWFSPYGYVRFAYDAIAKKKGLNSPYAQSLGNDLQYRQRINEATAGTLVMLGLASALVSSIDDEDDERPFKIVVTGNGPNRADDPQFHDTWHKNNTPNAVTLKFGKVRIPINTMRGFEAFAWPSMMLGAVDDWKIRRKLQRKEKNPTELGDAAVVAGNLFSAALKRGPYAFAAKPLFEAYGDRTVESLFKSIAFPAKTLIPVIGSSILRNTSDFINDPIDRRTIDGALWANVPFIGPAVAPKALNAFGEPSLSTDLASKMFKLGVPIVYDIPTDRESIKLHELVLKQGGGPSIPTRNQLAQRLDRQPTNKEYEMFVREYGTILTTSMKKNYDKLFNAKPEFYSRAIERIGNRARDVAENKVRQAAKKP